MISELKQTIDLAHVVSECGVELKRRGTSLSGRCPFHEDLNPSFFVFPDNRFKCFGCGSHGDVIDFVQKFYGLPFMDALKYLGIKQGRITPEVRQDIERRKRKAELVKEFKDWLNRYTAHVGSLIIDTENLMKKGIPREDLDLYASLLHGLPVWEYHLSILVEGSDEQKYLLYQEVKERKDYNKEAKQWKKKNLI